MPTFRRHPTAQGAWAALSQALRSRGTARALNLRRELTGMKMQRGETIMRYFNRGKELVWELVELVDAITDAQLVTALLAGLLPKYELMATVLTMQPGLTVETAQEQLQAAESRLGLDQMAGKIGEVANALAATHVGARPERRGRELRRCYKCDQIGHLKRDCPSILQGEPRDDETGSAGLAMLAHEVDTDTEDEPPALASDSDGDADAPPPVSDPAVANPALARDSGGDDVAPPLVLDPDVEAVGRHGTILMTLADPDDMEATPPASPIWVMDSGASHHMTGAAESLRSVAARAPVTIVLADGRRRTARTSGTAHLKVHGVAGALDLTLQDVLVIPGLTSSLFSVRQAALRGHEVIFQRGGGVVIQNGNRPDIRGLLADKVYILPTIAETDTALAAVGKPTAAMWHHRFAHLGVTSLERTAGAVAGMDLDKGELASLLRQPPKPALVTRSYCGLPG